MRRAMAVAVDLLCGIVLLGLVFAGTRLLLHDRNLVYLLFPCLSIAAYGLARGRARGGGSERALTVVALDLPLALAFAFLLSARDRGLTVLLAVTTAAAILGVSRAGWRAVAPILVGGNVALALALPAFVGLLVQSEEVKEPALSLTLRRIDAGGDALVPAAQLRGHIVVLDFWATWCVPCRRELPEIDRLAKRLGGQAMFFAVDSAMTDEPGDAGDTPEKARRALASQGLTLPLAWSGDGVLETACRIHGLPALVVLDRAGRIRFRHVGYVESEGLSERLEGLIARLAAETDS